jgi:hypothetical protein
LALDAGHAAAMVMEMNRRIWLAGIGAAVLSGCGAAVGVGGGGVDSLASTRVRATSPEPVRRAVVEVFRAQDFTVLEQGADRITFQKRGGRSAEIAWTTIDNPNPVMIRPTVRWRKSGTGEFTVACEVEVAQQSTVAGETVRRPMVVGKSAYQGMLREVKQRVEAGR